MQAELDTCPYTRDGQTRAWVEARGLNRGARGLAPSWQYGVILGRLGQLKQVCTEQSHALALEEIEAQARQVDWYVRMNQDAEATCEAEATLALITALREDIGSSSDRDDAALISKTRWARSGDEAADGRRLQALVLRPRSFQIRTGSLDCRFPRGVLSGMRQQG